MERRVSSRFAGLALAALALLASRASAGGEPEAVAAGKRARIVCHFDGPEVAAAALPYAEAATAETLERLRLDPAGLKDPVEIHLYRTTKEYRAVEARLTAGQFAKNNAFTSDATRTAHLAMVPECSDEVLARLGPGSVVLRQVAHEAVHVTISHLLSSYRDQAAWFGEGLATNVADDVARKLGLSPSPEAAPFSSTRMVAVEKLREAGRLPPPTAIFADELGKLSTDESYAVWWSFFRFLSEREAARTRALLSAAVRQGGGRTWTKKVAGIAQRIWGRKGMARLEEDYGKYVAGLKPEWEQIYRSLEVRGDDLVQRAYAEVNAVAWKTAPVGRDGYSIAGKLEILPGGSPQMNVLLGRSDVGFVSATFRAGFGVTIFDYRSKDDDWKRLAAVSVPGLAPSAPRSFEVRVAGETVSVFLDGEEIARVKVAGRDLTGPYGLGVQAGGAGIWSNVTLR